MKFTTVIVFLGIIALQGVISMQSNTIRDDLQENSNDAKNVTALMSALNIENNDRALTLTQKNSVSKRVVETTTWIFKYALLHPFSFFITGCADAYYIFEDQPVLGVWVLIQYFTLVGRFTWPNTGLFAKLNRLAILCRISTPVMMKEETTTQTPNVMNDKPIFVSLIDDEEDIGNNNTNRTVTASKKKKGNCEKNCLIIFGHALMNEYFFLITALLTFIFTFDDSVPLAIFITAQIVAYLLRTKCPSMSSGRLLNRYAFDVGCPDAEAQSMNPSPNGFYIHAPNTLPKFDPLPQSYRERSTTNAPLQLTPNGNLQLNLPK